MQYFSLKQLLSIVVLLGTLLFLYFHRIILGLNFFWEDFLVYQFPAKYFLLNNLKEGILNFWNPYIFSGTLTLSDIQLGIFYPFNLLLIPFAKSDIGYMYWLLEIQVIFHLLLGGIFMYILLRYFRLSHFSSLVGGVIFALLPFFIVHLKHVNIVQSAIWLPLIFLFFHRALHNKSFSAPGRPVSGWRDSVLAGLFFGISTLAGHLQISYYIALFLVAYFIYFLISEKIPLNPLGSTELTTGFKKGEIPLNPPLVKGETGGFFKKSSFQLRNFYSQINKIRFPIRELTLVFIVFIIALGLSAIELIPYWEFTNLSIRTTLTYFSFSSSSSLNPFQFLITSFLPHFFGGQNESSYYWGDWTYWEMTIYLGIVTVFLTFIGYALLRNQKFIKFLFITALLSLTLAFGYHFFVYPIAYFVLPALKMFRVPARFIFLYSFSLVIIACFALDFFTKQNNFNKIKNFFSQNQRYILQVIYIFVISFVVISAAIVMFPEFLLVTFSLFSVSKEKIDFNIIIQNIAIFLLLILSIIFIGKNYFGQKISLEKLKLAIFSIIIIDLAWFGFEFNNGNTNPKDFYKEIDEITYLKNQDSKDYRVTTNNIIYPNTAFIYKFNDTSGYPATSSLLRYNEFTKANFWEPSFPSIKLNGLPNRSKLLNQCYILSDKELPSEQYENIDQTYLYKFRDCLPRVLLIHNFEIEKNPEEILRKIDDVNFNPLETIILEKDLGLVDYDYDYDYDDDKVEITKYSPDYIEIKSKSDKEGILFLSEVYYPGWEAYVDGAKTEIYQANYLFRAVALQAGEHKIEFIYNPRIFKIGAIISLVSLVVSVLLILVPSKNHFNALTH